MTSRGRLRFVVLTCILIAASATIDVPIECDGKVDVTFLIDDSASLGETDPPGRPQHTWNTLKTFTKNVVRRLPVGVDTRVAAIRFSTNADLQFVFSSHNNSASVQDALQVIKHTGGNTNTAAALKLARIRLYNGAEDRTDARKVVILLTDGLSNLDVNSTEPEATSLKAAGVEVFTVGITKYIDRNHLRRISSDPHETHFIHVLEFARMNAILNKLVYPICKLPVPTGPTPEKCLIPRCEECVTEDTCVRCQVGWYWDTVSKTCEECQVYADIAFVIDNSGSIRDKNPEDKSYDNYILLKQFIKNLLARLDISPQTTRIGAVRFSNKARLMFNLGKYSNREDINAAIDKTNFEGGKTNTSGGLRTMRTQVFGGGHGDRPDVRNVAIVITDGESTVDKNKTLVEATLAKDEGIVIFVVGVTDLINEAELKGIASDPDATHYFNSTSIRQLDTILQQLTKSVCSPDNPSATRNRKRRELPQFVQPNNIATYRDQATEKATGIDTDQTPCGTSLVARAAEHLHTLYMTIYTNLP